MSQFTEQQLAEILEKHRRWLLNEDGGEHADLRGAYLRDACLGGANLRDAYLGDAYLGDAYLGGANLGGANLGGANLRDAYLGGAYLGGANLGDAYLREIDSMNGASGNCREVKAIQAGIWPVTYTATHMQIGCQLHAIGEWWAFTDDEIKPMDGEALDWWRVWKPMLQQIIETSPAVPGGEKPVEEGAA